MRKTSSKGHTPMKFFALLVLLSTSLFAQTDGPALLPQITPVSSMAQTPAPGLSYLVRTSADFQNYLNNVIKCGDTLNLVAGQEYDGLFTLPNLPCDDNHWIIIRSSAPDSSFPVEGMRINPCYAGVTSLPGRPAFSCSTTISIMPKLVYSSSLLSNGPIIFAPGANHYRIFGLEFTRSSPGIHLGALITAQGTATNIVFDRIWLHGQPQEETKAGILLSGMYGIAIVDSYFSDFMCISVSGACQDAHAIGGGVTTTNDGNYKISNNFLEASGQSMLLGGGPGTTTPCDITISRNHLFKNPLWQPGVQGQITATDGHAFIVKNNFELKNACRVLFEGNYLEQVWGGFTQAGWSIVLTVANQNGNCPNCRVTDVTVRYNVIFHAGGGIVVVNGANTVPPVAGNHYSIHDNIVDDIQKKFYNGTGNFIEIGSQWPSNQMDGLYVANNTANPDPIGKMISITSSSGLPLITGFNFSNNLMLNVGNPPITGSGPSSCANTPSNPNTQLNLCFSQWIFSGNDFANVPKQYTANKWPVGNSFLIGPITGYLPNYVMGVIPSYVTNIPNVGADVSTIQQKLVDVY